MMSRNPTVFAGLNRDVLAALSKEPDYSMAFTNEVASLRRAIEGSLFVPIEHDDDMNYSAAQKLVVWLDRECHSTQVRDPKATYRLINFVSSRSRFFAMVALNLCTSTEKHERRTESWKSLTNRDWPDGIKDVQKKIASIMKSHGYVQLEGTILSQEASGHLTRMDERPATVFDVLFSEIY